MELEQIVVEGYRAWRANFLKLCVPIFLLIILSVVVAVLTLALSFVLGLVGAVVGLIVGFLVLLAAGSFLWAGLIGMLAEAFEKGKTSLGAMFEFGEKAWFRVALGFLLWLLVLIAVLVCAMILASVGFAFTYFFPQLHPLVDGAANGFLSVVLLAASLLLAPYFYAIVVHAHGPVAALEVCWNLLRRHFGSILSLFAFESLFFTLAGLGLWFLLSLLFTPLALLVAPLITHEALPIAVVLFVLIAGGAALLVVVALLTLGLTWWAGLYLTIAEG